MENNLNRVGALILLIVAAVLILTPLAAGKHWFPFTVCAVPLGAVIGGLMYALTKGRY